MSTTCGGLENLNIRLVKRFKGRNEADMNPEELGVGEWCKTLRQRAEDYKFRHGMLARASSGEVRVDGDCSIAAAMLLDVFARDCQVDQMKLSSLKNACAANGLSQEEICCAIGELEMLDMIMLYFHAHQETVFVKTMDPMGTQYQIEAGDAMTFSNSKAR